MPTIAVVNEKGGTGKTTTAVSLSAALARKDNRVLTVDLDGQAAASRWLGSEEDHRLANALVAGGGLDPLQTAVPNLWLAPASGKLDSVAHDLRPTQGGQLRRVLAEVKDRFDYIVIDCPPSLGNRLIGNAMLAATHAVVPVETSILALDGLGIVLTTLSDIREGFNHDLRLLGAVGCRYDARTRLSRLVMQEMRRALPNHVFSTAIRASVKLQECPATGTTIFDYDPRGTAAADYAALAEEVVAAIAGAAISVDDGDMEIDGETETVTNALAPEDQRKLDEFRDRAATAFSKNASRQTKKSEDDEAQEEESVATAPSTVLPPEEDLVQTASSEMLLSRDPEAECDETPVGECDESQDEMDREPQGEQDQTQAVEPACQAEPVQEATALWVASVPPGPVENESAVTASSAMLPSEDDPPTSCDDTAVAIPSPASSQDDECEHDYAADIVAEMDKVEAKDQPDEEEVVTEQTAETFSEEDDFVQPRGAQPPKAAIIGTAAIVLMALAGFIAYQATGGGPEQAQAVPAAIMQTDVTVNAIADEPTTTEPSAAPDETTTVQPAEPADEVVPALPEETAIAMVEAASEDLIDGAMPSKGELMNTPETTEPVVASVPAEAEQPRIEEHHDKSVVLYPAPPQLVLTGTIRNARGGMAIINGQAVRVGQRISGVELVSVANQRAELSFAGRSHTLVMGKPLDLGAE